MTRPTMLDNMRYDLAGTSYKTSATDAGDREGCPDTGCNGYELMANIDLLPLLDANTNGEIDMTTKTVVGKDHTVIDVGPGKDTSWSPVGDNSTNSNASRFTGTFEGNGNTIANLWVNISSSGNAVVYAGLFGVTGGSAEIRNVGVISGGVFGSSSGSLSHSGGLVGWSASSSPLTITNSYFSGEGGVSSSAASSDSYSGGLVGVSSSSSSLTITNSYFSGSGGVFSSSSSSSTAAASYSGGLVGSSTTLTITNSYFSGIGGVSSSSAAFPSFSFSGGLVGSSNAILMITNSYFSGSGGVSSSSSSSGSSSYSGGLVGFSSSSLTITNSYWNTDAPQSTDGGVTLRNVGNKRTRGNSTSEPMGAVRLTLAQLKATSGTFPDLGDAWDLGTDQQLPAVKLCILDMAGMGTCASYGDLLDGQR